MKRCPLICLTFSLLLAAGLPRATATEPGPDKDPTGDAGALKDKVETGCGYDPRTGNASRSITDLHVPGAVGENGLDFTRHWNSLQAQPEIPTSTPFGPAGWTHSWNWSVHYDEEIIQAEEGGLQCFRLSLTITFPDGRETKYYIDRGAGTHWGPPYSPQEACFSPGGTVSDHLCGMQADGKKFWLYLGDGGSVRFEESPSLPWLPTAVVGYRATRMLDRHGLETNLFYDDLGNLVRVTEPGGRSILITWGYLPGRQDPVISKVSGGGPANIAQVVQYNYTLYAIAVPPPGNGGVYSHALTGVNYGVGERSATYSYVLMPQDLIGLVLDEADDPRFMGPMKRIRYSYRGTWCGFGPQLDYYKAPPTAITAEMNEQGIPVSQLLIDCPSGHRTETNGRFVSRMFYYGRSAPIEPGGHFVGDLQTGHWVPPEAGDFNHLSHHLVKITEFNPDGRQWEDVPFHYQHYKQAYPWRIFDPNGNITQVTTASGTGRTTEIWRRADNSKHKYNWSNPGASLARDTMHIPNTLNHWLFSETDERNLTTTYTRDALRRVTDITYPDNTAEHFTYNEFNQIRTHTLANSTVMHYEYDSRGLLRAEWNSADGEGEVTAYEYDSLDRVWIVRNPLAASRGFSYSAMMEYNARHQVIKVHYPPTGGNSDPTVQYEYSPDGDCIAITNELGQRSTYKYDNYRRVVKYTEPLNAPGPDGSGNVAAREWKWYYGRTTTTNVPVSPYAHTSKQWSHQYEPAYNAAGDCRVTVREYDVNDRMTAEQTGWIQPAQGSLYFSPADGETHHFTYDANGNKSSYTDPRDRVTNYEYNSRDWLITMTETATAPPRITRLEYDIAGNKTKVTFPDSETQQWPANGYDAFGQPHVFIDERDNATNMDYWPWGPMKKLAGVITHRAKDDGGSPRVFTTTGRVGPGKRFSPMEATNSLSTNLGR
jgi:YD repeat-containing protein